MDLLAETLVVSDQQDLEKVLGAKWYAKINVVTTQHLENTSFDTCESYLSEVTEATHTYRENEVGAFLEIAIMCRSTELLLNAKESEVSNTPVEFLNKSMPKQFPVELAFQTSTIEAGRNAKDASKIYWGDINDSLKFESVSEEQVIFSGEGGYQNIALVDRGDFNHDGI